MLRKTIFASLLASSAITLAIASPAAAASKADRAREAIAAAEAKLNTAESLGAATEAPRDTAEARVLQIAHAALAIANGASVSVGTIADNFNAMHSTEYGGPRSNRWIGHILRTRLHLTTHKSDGIYVLSASELPKIEALVARMGV